MDRNQRRDGELIVKGRVVFANNEPAPGLVVRAYDRDVRTFESLGKDAITGADGEYEICYSRADFRRADQKSKADLVIRVFPAHGVHDTTTMLAESAIQFNAPAKAEINLQLTTTSDRRSEFERNIGQVLPRLVAQLPDGSDLSLTALTSDDVNFLARDTGIEATQIQLLVQSAKAESAVSSALNAQIFYGWFRRGMPTALDALWKKSTNELLTTLLAAARQGIISALDAAEQKLLRARIDQIRLDQTLKLPPPGTQAGLGDLLATMPSPPAQAQQRALAAAAKTLRPDDPNLVKAVAAVPGFDGDAAAVARTLRLGALTDGYLPLAQALQSCFKDSDSDDGSLRPLAAIRPEEWIDLAYTHGTPEGNPIGPDDYGITLAAHIEQQHPTAALAMHVAEGGGLSQHPLLSDVATFLSNNPAFDIVSADLNVPNDQAEMKGIEDTERLGKGLLTLQRFNSLGTSWRNTATLMTNDLYSPQQLLAAGLTQLSGLLDGQLPSDTIVALHGQAADLHSATFATLTAALSPLSAPEVLPDSQSQSPVVEVAANADEPAHTVGFKDLVATLKTGDAQFNPTQYKSLRPFDSEQVSNLKNRFNFDDVVASQPTLQSLFGSQDACTCGHCSSVLSPAAYYVDLMQFIRNAAPSGQLLDRLLQRRPDLQDIELTCSNSNTEVPTIDLALETLENAVALPLTVDLPPGTSLDQQLQDGQPAGAAVRTALERTVRAFLGEGRATRLAANADGTKDWAVIDLHRRWTLTARPNDGVWAQSDAWGKRELDTTGLNLSDLIQALDHSSVPKDAQPLLVRLVAPNQKSAYSDYQVNVTPLTAGQSWKLSYHLVVKLTVDTVHSELTLQPALGKPWLEKHYDKKTIDGLQQDLARERVPELVRLLITARFPDAGKLSVKKTEARGGNVWSIISPTRNVTLTYTAKQLVISSLAYQSGDPAADPIAEPENRDPEAYVRLKAARFPWTLPLDLPWEELRAFLERARSSRQQLLELMLPIDVASSTDLALESLGLGADEANLIATEAAAPAIYDYWGIPATQNFIFDASIGGYLRGTPPPVLLKNVSVLLQQARVRFEELQAILATEFVTRGGTALLTISPRTSCKPSEMNLVGLSDGHLDRLHRFIRLWRRLGWTVRELDLALQAFGGQLTSATLVGLSDVQWLKQKLGVPLAVLVGGLDRLETRSWVDYLAEDAPVTQLSLYVSVFQREAVRKATDFAAFALRLDAAELQNTPNPGISLHADYVANCISVDPAVVGAWVAAGNALGLDDTLNLVHLSRLTAAAALCNALQLDPAQLTNQLLLRGAASSPFRSGISMQERLSALREFVEQYADLAKAGLDAETLRYVLQHYEAPGSDAVLSTLQVTQFTAAARDAVSSIADAADPQNAQLVARTQVAREDAAIAALASALGGSRELVDELLRNRLSNPADANKPGIDAILNGADDVVSDLIVRLNKSLILCDALKFVAADLSVLRSSANDPKGFTALVFDLLPVAAAAAPMSFQDFEQLLALARLRTLAPKGGDLLHHYIVPDDGAAWSAAGARAALATGFAVDPAEIKAAADKLHITTDAQYRDPLALESLIELLAALQNLGATVKLATDLTAPSPGATAALEARELLRSKFGDSQWHDLIKPIEDKLRKRQREALVDYLVAREQLRDANDLYEYYLIDVQTGSCVKTTRLLQATAAVQLFVQRVLLNLEPGASLSSDKRDLWEWMSSYRVWEANRKVFLFPENWLLPELRDDKTALFRDMESSLSEGEPDPDSMRSALLGYVEGLGDLAQIKAVAMYQDERVIGKDAQGQDIVEHTLYVIGRTPNSPYRYFWRSCGEFGTPEMSWTGWEALDLDNANDFIMPFVFEGELHVAWPILHKTKEQKTEDHDTAQLFWEVQLAWTRLSNKGWVKRKIGAAQLENILRLTNKDEVSSFAFRLNKQVLPVPGSSSLQREIITIDCYAAHEVVNIPSFTPDPALEDADPFGDNYDKNYGYGTQWNVACTVEGTLYKYFDRGQAEGGLFYETCAGTVQLHDTRRQDNFLSAEDLPIYECGVQSDGTFRFWFPTTQSGANGSEGLLNGSDIRITIDIPGAPQVFEKTVSLVKKNPGHDDEYALKWTWRINHGIEDDSLKSIFDSARSVQLSTVGNFVFETGKDLAANRLDPSDPGTTLSSDLDIFNADNNSLPQPDQSPVSAVLATQVVGSNDPAIWYVTESDNNSYFLQIDYTTWNRWSDGQPFAGTYRIAAAASTIALFQPDNQQHLHLDAAANTFDRQNVYANYNWELFLHTPLAIADFLASQQRFEDARRWLHAVFDPTTDQTVGNKPQYWRFRQFSNDSQPDAIAKLLTWLADPGAGDPTAEAALTSQIEQWKRNPFMPHLIARLRPSAYQWYTFFAYLNVLIGWGDQLFRRDTRESVNEATLLYVLAAKLLGPRPRSIQAPTTLPPQTYRSLSVYPLDDFSNAWVQYSDLPGVRRVLALARSSQANNKSQQFGDGLVNVSVNNVGSQTTGIQILTSFGLAFCIPQNDKIDGYYDLIERRLLDVRNCRNIDGAFRELPLYDPPIDPLLLIRARAAGLDIATVVADLYAPLPNYRFTFTLQKAVEFCSEVKSLGAALLSALEKQDAEQLTLLRSTHEIAMLKLVRDVRQKQIDEAEANIVSLQQSQATVLERFSQFQKLLGKTGITKGQDGLPVVEQSSSLTVSTDPIGAASGLGFTRMEVDQLRFSAIGHVQTQIAGAVQVVAGVISLIPNIFAGTPFAGQTSGGTNFGIGANAISKSIELIASEANYLASQAGTFGGYERRQDDWVYQSRLALAELKQLDKQILAAQIRRDIAQHEFDDHDQQIADAIEVDEFMRSKFTNQQLFRWMSSQIAEVYFRTYQLALDQARRAERAFRRELGLDETTAPYVQSDNWDSLKRGLLAGERLHHDLKRMESAFLERNVREFEITRHVSLLQLDPMALITLRETGSCDFTVPEALFDLDCPGHYMRRMKTVSLSIPCVAGGYASVSANLQLQKNEIRVDPTATADDYAHLPPGEDDSRFITNTAPTMAIVTSNSQQDSGMFETNLRDERYLPFEGAGVISTWHLELPAQLRQFDYQTISDVILHIRYTSRDKGADLKDAVTAYLSDEVGKAEAAGMVRLFSIRHEFPTAWAKFVATAIDGNNTKTSELSLDLRPEHYPFWSTGRLKNVQQASAIARVGDGVGRIDIVQNANGTGTSDALTAPGDARLAKLRMGTLTNLGPKSPVTETNKPFKLNFKENSMTDLWLAITWKGTA